MEKKHSLMCFLSMWFLVVYMDVQFIPLFVHRKQEFLET